MLSFLNRLKTVARLSIKPPDAMPNRHGIAIVAIVKNEAKYIAEWADFHYKAGVRHFYIYDNGSSDETCNVLKTNLPQDALTIVPWNQTIDIANQGQVIHNQVLAYAHAASNFGGHYRWMTFIDVDEFIIPKRETSILAALESLQNCQNISLPWHMFGTNGHLVAPVGSIIENYDERYASTSDFRSGLVNYKCIVDPCSLTTIRVHSMQTNNDWLTSNDVGFSVKTKHRDTTAFYSSINLQLNHYYTRSKAEFTAKMNKGHILQNRSSRYSEKLPKLLAKIDSDVIKDASAKDFLMRLDKL